jgi:hypothetical protein
LPYINRSTIVTIAVGSLLLFGSNAGLAAGGHNENTSHGNALRVPSKEAQGAPAWKGQPKPQIQNSHQILGQFETETAHVETETAHVETETAHVETETAHVETVTARSPLGSKNDSKSRHGLPQKSVNPVVIPNNRALQGLSNHLKKPRK